MQKIKNVLLDLGGVLLNIDYHRTADAFRQLGATDFTALYSQTGANELFEALETGQISESDFYAALAPYCHPGTTIAQMEAAWNAILGDFRLQSVAYLKQLGAQYRLFLLSNTNSIHHRAFEQLFTEATGQPSLDVYFEKAWYSHQLNRRKPYPATYQHVLELAGLAASETLFVDDSLVNIEGAIEAGLHTHLLLHPQQLEEVVIE